MRRHSADNGPESDVLELGTEAVRKLVAALVDDPDKFPVSSDLENGVVAVRIRFLAGGDAGQVIGKGGRNIDALRILTHAIFAKHRLRAYIETVE